MLEVAVVGTGSISNAHIHGLLVQRDICHVAALVNRTLAKARDIRKQYDLDAEIYSTLDDACDHHKIDAVVICLPAELHCQATINALDRGCHVLVEKPMANSVEECQIMLEAAKKAGKLLSVAFQNRFSGENQRLYQILHSGEIGSVCAGTVNSLWWRGNNYYKTEWRGYWRTEHGGVFLGHAIHQIDLLLWMLGMPDKVTASIHNVGHPDSELEDWGIAALIYPRCVVNLQASLVSHEQKQELIFQTEKGQYASPWNPYAQNQMENGFPYQAEENINALKKIFDKYTIKKNALSGHDALICNFLRAIKGEEDLLISGEDGLHALELVTAIYKSEVKGKTVAIPLDNNDPFCNGSYLESIMKEHMTEKLSRE